MARQRKYLQPKPGKEHLLVKRGRKAVPSDIKDALAGMKAGEAREGFLGGENITRKPDFIQAPEKLDPGMAIRKKAIKDLLISVIQPVSLSSKSTPEMDRRAFINKVNKRTYEELRRFLPERVDSLATEELKESNVLEEEKAEIQQLYMVISP